jgi:hypothetical protein
MLLGIWLKDFYIKKKLLQTTMSPIDKSELYLKLTKICGEIKRDLNANGVYIAYFHNGDFFKNGLSIEKFTVVAEDYDEHIGVSYIASYANKPIQYITYLYHRLLTDGRCYKKDIPNLKMIDNVYKQDCLSRNVNSTYSFIIKDSDEKPIGLVSVEYSDNICFKLDDEKYIWKHQMTTSKKIQQYKS